MFGAGNSGAAVNKFVAPVILVAAGWAMVPKVYAAIMLGTAILFWFGSAHDPKHLVPAKKGGFTAQLKALKDPQGAEVLPVLLHRVRRLCGLGTVDGAVLRANMVWTSASRRCWPLAFAAGWCVACDRGYLSDKHGAHKVTWWVMGLLDLSVPSC